jgi:flavin reductase (DIM6/NTAB) family NADH-FMN oxidoreductase RutF
MDSDTEIQLRRSLGQFATGVTVVTCCASDGSPRGITANSFSSVSLAPPLVLWNIAKLKSDQQSFAEHFARADHTIYNGIDYDISGDNVPILPDVLARFDCTTEAIHDAGDHHIIVGRVLAHMAGSGSPLLFHGGEYVTAMPG